LQYFISLRASRRAERGGVAILCDGVGLIEAKDIVSEAAQSGEDAWVAAVRPHVMHDHLSVRTDLPFEGRRDGTVVHSWATQQYVDEGQPMFWPSRRTMWDSAGKTATVRPFSPPPPEPPDHP